MDLLGESQLIKPDGSEISPTEALADARLIAFYFSAQWCPPCKAFTPVLCDFCETLTDELQCSLHVVLVSSDRSEADMLAYLSESGRSDWLAVAFNGAGEQLRRSLSQRYSVTSIPALVFVRASDSSVAELQGRQVVMKEGPTQSVYNRLVGQTSNANVNVTANVTIVDDSGSGQVTSTLSQAEPQVDLSDKTVEIPDPDKQTVNTDDVMEKEWSLVDSLLMETWIYQGMVWHDDEMMVMESDDEIGCLVSYETVVRNEKYAQ